MLIRNITLQKISSDNSSIPQLYFTNEQTHRVGIKFGGDFILFAADDLSCLNKLKSAETQQIIDQGAQIFDWEYNHRGSITQPVTLPHSVIFTGSANIIKAIERAGSTRLTRLLTPDFYITPQEPLDNLMRLYKHIILAEDIELSSVSDKQQTLLDFIKIYEPLADRVKLFIADNRLRFKTDMARIYLSISNESLKLAKNNILNNTEPLKVANKYYDLAIQSGLTDPMELAKHCILRLPDTFSDDNDAITQTGTHLNHALLSPPYSAQVIQLFSEWLLLPDTSPQAAIVCTIVEELEDISLLPEQHRHAFIRLHVDLCKKQGDIEKAYILLKNIPHQDKSADDWLELGNLFIASLPHHPAKPESQDTLNNIIQHLAADLVFFILAYTHNDASSETKTYSLQFIQHILENFRVFTQQNFAGDTFRQTILALLKESDIQNMNFCFADQVYVSTNTKLSVDQVLNKTKRYHFRKSTLKQFYQHHPLQHILSDNQLNLFLLKTADQKEAAARQAIAHELNLILQALSSQQMTLFGKQTSAMSEQVSKLRHAIINEGRLTPSAILVQHNQAVTALLVSFPTLKAVLVSYQLIDEAPENKLRHAC